MKKQNLQIEGDHLAVGLTKSPMFMGVNIKTFFANVVFCALLSINAHTAWGIPLFVILHVLFAKMSIKEPDFLSIYLKAFFKTYPLLNRKFWGNTNSYEPW